MESQSVFLAFKFKVPKGQFISVGSCDAGPVRLASEFNGQMVDRG